MRAHCVYFLFGGRLAVRSITTKYIAVGLIILTLMAIFTAMSFYLTNRIKGDARRINLAGRERMLSFEMAWLLNKAANEKGQERAKDLNYLKENMTLFEEVLYALKDGSKKYELDPLPHVELISRNNDLIKEWVSEIKPALMKAVEGSPEALTEYNSIIYGYVSNIDNFVKQIETEYAEEIRLYARLRYFVLIIAVFTFIGIILYVKNHLVRPIRILRTGAIEIGKGNFDVKIDVKTSDEIGVLAYEFNRMSCDLKKLYGDLKRKNQRLLKLHDVAMTPSGDIAHVSNKITSAIAETLNVKAASIVDIKGDEGWIASMYKNGETISSGGFPLKYTPYNEVKINKDYVYHDDALKKFPEDPFLNKYGLTTYLGIPLINNKGEVVCILSVMDDRRRDFYQEDVEFLYTLGKKLALAIEIKNEEAEKRNLEAQLFQSQKMESIGTLAAGIAHDFNNMLTGITGYIDIARAQASEEGIKKHLDKALKITEKAAELSKQILIIGRKMMPERRAQDINQLIDDCIKTIRRMVEENIEITASLKPDLPMIQVDPSQITQVIMNLVVNARDAMPDGGKIEIRTEEVSVDEEYCKYYTWAKPGNYVAISVSDTGIGIPEDIRHRIFEPFFTTKEFGKGTGLGLAITYSIVKNHGGWINLYSEVGKGSEFKVYIPVVSSGAELEVSQEKSSKEKIFTGGSETILLVDDEDIVREVGESMLRNLGYRVITAANGEEAVATYKERGSEIDLVIMDKMMPKMNGITAYRALKEINPLVKVIISSGYIVDSIQSLRELGVADFLNKPYRMDEMAKAVRKAIDLKPQ
jgi:signal transduction histidine kinase/HAMP domain-containing protein